MVLSIGDQVNDRSYKEIEGFVLTPAKQNPDNKGELTERQLEAYQKIERSIIKKFRSSWTPFIATKKRYER